MTKQFQLVSFDDGQGPVAGKLIDGKLYRGEQRMSMRDVLERWDELRPSLEQGGVFTKPVEGEPRLLAPVDPVNLYFVGCNYVDHVEEMQRTLKLPLDAHPDKRVFTPWISMQATTSVTGPGSRIAIPDYVTKLDWEVELAVVIGRGGYRIAQESALSHIAGYMGANDLSARNMMGRDCEDPASPFYFDWLSHKSFPGSAPMGPGLTPAWQIEDVQNLKLELWLNGDLMQDSSTANMIFSVAEVIYHLSQRARLSPGDVILTGTPAGVGTARQRFLRAGDHIRQRVEGLGEFEFTME